VLPDRSPDRIRVQLVQPMPLRASGGEARPYSMERLIGVVECGCGCGSKLGDQEG